MKIEKDNHEFYRSTFDKIHASDELVGKVKNMTKVEAKKKMYVMKKVLCIAAVVAVLFVASNLVTYAATGESWVEMLVLHVRVNGEEMDVEAQKITDENGNVSYQIPLTVDEEDGTENEYCVEFEGSASETLSKVELDTEVATPELVEENGKVYLELSLFDIKEDITEDSADGKASVEGELLNGGKTTITVEGTVDSYVMDYDKDVIADIGMISFE